MFFSSSLPVAMGIAALSPPLALLLLCGCLPRASSLSAPKFHAASCGIDLGTTTSSISMLIVKRDDDGASEEEGAGYLPVPVVSERVSSTVDLYDTDDDVYFRVGSEGGTYRSCKRILGKGYGWLSAGANDGGAIGAPLAFVKPQRASGGKGGGKRRPLNATGVAEDYKENPLELRYSYKSLSDDATGDDGGDYGYDDAPLLPTLTPASAPLTPEVVSSYVITDLLMGHPDLLRLKGVVCGVPAYFSDIERELTSDAVKIGYVRALKLKGASELENSDDDGDHDDDDEEEEEDDDIVEISLDEAKCCSLKVKIITEPEACGLAYSLMSGLEEDKASASPQGVRTSSSSSTNSPLDQKSENVMVFDLGGGTFDLTVMSVGYKSNGLVAGVEIIASDGDKHLGGDDFDAQIEKLLRKRYGGDGWGAFAREVRSFRAVYTQQSLILPAALLASVSFLLSFLMSIIFFDG